MTKVSFYNNIADIDSSQLIDLDIFISNIREGIWQDEVLKVRTVACKDKQKALKKKCPQATISGSFKNKKDSEIIQHSNFICIDIDNIDPQEGKRILSNDPFCYAAFVSIGGYGLAVIFRIDGKRHREAFYGISKYLEEKYNLLTDKSCVNESRGRFVSHDPYIYVNESAKKFTKYLKEKSKPSKQIRYIFVKSDFDRIISEIQTRSICIADDYLDWLYIGFALVSEFGENGRQYFHVISSQSAKYNQNECDKKYNNLLKNTNGNWNKSTLYYYFKQAGIQIYNQEVKEIISNTASQKRNRSSDNEIIDNLSNIGGYDRELVSEIVPQVTEKTTLEDISLIEQIETEIRNLYKIRRNSITKRIEVLIKQDWRPINKTILNSIFCRIAKVYPKTSLQLIESIIDSDQTVDFNPLINFIEENKHISRTGLIEEFANCITSKIGIIGSHRNSLITKWYVSLIASIHGQHSPLMLVLAGSQQGTGKTETFRRLLPEPLKSFYAESNLDAKNTDDRKLMTEKLLIVNDEFGGKTVRDIEKLKSLLSTQYFNMRIVWGKNNEDYRRLAVLGATSNNFDLLNDPTGNRRIIPIHVQSIDWERFNLIDKTAMFIEAFHLFESGFNWQLNQDEIQLMAKGNEDFKSVCVEEELLWKFYRIPNAENEGKGFTTTDIKSRIEASSGQKLNLNKLGECLKRELGQKKYWTTEHGKRRSGYFLTEIFEDGYVPNDLPKFPF